MNRLFAGMLPVVVLLGLTGCPAGEPFLYVSPAAFDFGGATESNTLTIVNKGRGQLDWHVHGLPGWLSLDATAGTVTTSIVDNVTMTVARAGLDAGVYSDTFVVASNAGSRVVHVTMSVLSPPDLAIDAALLELNLNDEGVITLRNRGTSALAWTASLTGSSRFGISETAGAIPGLAESEVIVSFDRVGAQPGVYTVTVDFASDGGDVSVEVSAVVAMLTVSPASIDFGLAETSATLTVGNSGNDPLDWTLAPDAGLGLWMEASSTGGTLAAGAETDVALTIDRGALAPGTHSGEITVASGIATFTVPVTAAVESLVVLPTALALPEDETQTSFTVLNDGNTPFDWTITIPPGVEWIRLSDIRGSLDAQAQQAVTLIVDRDRVPAGTQQAALTVSSPTAGSETVQVSMDVPPRAPQLAVQPGAVDFGQVQLTARQRLMGIWNAGDGTLNWSIDPSTFPEWLTLGAGSPTSGTVTGSEVNAVYLHAAPGDLPVGTYEGSFAVSSDAGNVTVTARMQLRDAPLMQVTPASVFIPEDEVTATFTIESLDGGRGTLQWSIANTADFPFWLDSVLPGQGQIAPGAGPTRVTLTVDREGGPSNTSLTFDLQIESNATTGATRTVPVTVVFPPKIVIGTSTSRVEIDGNRVSTAFQVANMGDPDTELYFRLNTDRADWPEWAFVYPTTGYSVGNNLPPEFKDWRTINVSVDRTRVPRGGAEGRIEIYAYDPGQGPGVALATVEKVILTIQVKTQPLTTQTARARTRIPSMVRFVLMLRDATFRRIPLAQAPEGLEHYSPSFTLYEDNQLLEYDETNQFLSDQSRTRTNIALLLDYSNSMYLAAQRAVMEDPALRAAVEARDDGDPLQAIYEHCIGELIDDIFDKIPNARVGLLEFHDRGQPTRMRHGFIDRVANYAGGGNRLRAALEAIDIRTHGATELLPAVEGAAAHLLLDDLGRHAFDDADVRMIVCVSDGRLTTPPGEIKDTIDFLYDDYNVRGVFVGWGDDIAHEPMARIAAATGGNYYPARPVLTDDGPAPSVDNLFAICAGDDEATDPDDQSIAKDYASQVVLSYVTLNHTEGVTTRIGAGFENPFVSGSGNAFITGSTEQDIDFDLIVGDVRMGQLSMRTEGIQENDTARVVVRAEYIPRGVTEFRLTFWSDPVFPFTVGLIPDNEGGLIAGWDITDLGGGEYLFAASEDPDAAPLTYGAFGDLVELNFTGVTDPAMRVFMSVDDSIYDINNDGWLEAYFLYPDSLPVDASAAMAPAFPAPLVVPASVDFGGTASTAQMSIRNVGGTYDYNGPRRVYLNWELLLLPEYLSANISGGSITNGTLHANNVTLTLDRSALAPGMHVGTIGLGYDGAELGIEGIVLVPVTVLIGDPALQVDPDALDFGWDSAEERFTIFNTGQSTLRWEMTLDAAWPEWLSLAATSGVAGATPVEVAVVLDREKAPVGQYTFTNAIRGYDVWHSQTGAAESLTVSVTIPAITTTTSLLDFGAAGTTGTFRITNDSAAPVSWGASSSDAWAGPMSPSSGTLNAGEDVLVEVVIDRSGLVTGENWAVVEVTDTGSGAVQVAIPVLATEEAGP